MISPEIFQPDLKSRLAQEVSNQLSVLTDLYKHFHAHPELSQMEEKTAACMAQELALRGTVVHTGIGGHGVAALMENNGGPFVLIRADMDALPLKEMTGVPHASTVQGMTPDGRQFPVMHACGHDVHITCLLGVAQVLNNLKSFWKGRVLFVAQPAEETVAGADLMMKDGLYQRFGRPDCALALHVNPLIAAGSVGLSSGIQSSCTHTVDLIVKGIGGHGASPHLTKDPIVLSAQIITAIQTIISRETAPGKMGVITVGAIHGGTKRNIIPEEVVMNITIRAFEKQVADNILNSLKRITENLAAAFGLPQALWPEIKIPEPSYLPVVNDPDLTRTVKAAFCELLGREHVEGISAGNGAEDFSFFSQAEPPVPVLMFKLGVTSKEQLEAEKNGKAKIFPLHDPRFYPDLGSSLETGVKSLAAAALSVLIKG